MKLAAFRNDLSIDPLFEQLYDKWYGPVKTQCRQDYGLQFEVRKSPMSWRDSEHHSRLPSGHHNFWKNMNRWFHQPINRTKPWFTLGIIADLEPLVVALQPNATILFIDVAVEPEMGLIKNVSHRTLIQLHNLETLLRCKSFHDEMANDTEEKEKNQWVFELTGDVLTPLPSDYNLEHLDFWKKRLPLAHNSLAATSVKILVSIKFCWHSVSVSPFPIFFRIAAKSAFDWRITSESS